MERAVSLFDPGVLTVIAGYTAAELSAWVDELAMTLARRLNRRFAYWTADDPAARRLKRIETATAAEVGNAAVLRG